MSKLKFVFTPISAKFLPGKRQYNDNDWYKLVDDALDSSSIRIPVVLVPNNTKDISLAYKEVSPDGIEFNPYDNTYLIDLAYSITGTITHKKVIDKYDRIQSEIDLLNRIIRKADLEGKKCIGISDAAFNHIDSIAKLYSCNGFTVSKTNYGYAFTW